MEKMSSTLCPGSIVRFGAGTEYKRSAVVLKDGRYLEVKWPGMKAGEKRFFANGDAWSYSFMGKGATLADGIAKGAITVETPSQKAVWPAAKSQMAVWPAAKSQMAVGTDAKSQMAVWVAAKSQKAVGAAAKSQKAVGAAAKSQKAVGAAAKIPNGWFSQLQQYFK